MYLLIVAYILHNNILKHVKMRKKWGMQFNLHTGCSRILLLFRLFLCISSNDFILRTWKIRFPNEHTPHMLPSWVKCRQLIVQTLVKILEPNQSVYATDRYVLKALLKKDCGHAWSHLDNKTPMKNTRTCSCLILITVCWLSAN